MQVFSLQKEQEWNPQKHVERTLGRFAEGDMSIACWEPGQVSPYHCHPEATEIYFCFEGGGKMRTPERTIDVVPGSFVVHPRGDLHEYINGPQRTMLFRVRYGPAMYGRRVSWDTQPGSKQTDEDIAYFKKFPERLREEAK